MRIQEILTNMFNIITYSEFNVTFVYGDGLTILAHNRLLSKRSSFLGDILDIMVKKERGGGRWQTISHGRLICVDRENKYKSAMLAN